MSSHSCGASSFGKVAQPKASRSWPIVAQSYSPMRRSTGFGSLAFKTALILAGIAHTLQSGISPDRSSASGLRPTRNLHVLAGDRQGDAFHRRRHLTLQLSGCGTLSIDRAAKVRHYPRSTKGERGIMGGQRRAATIGMAVAIGGFAALVAGTAGA